MDIDEFKCKYTLWNYLKLLQNDIFVISNNDIFTLNHYASYYSMVKNHNVIELTKNYIVTGGTFNYDTRTCFIDIIRK